MDDGRIEDLIGRFLKAQTPDSEQSGQDVARRLAPTLDVTARLPGSFGSPDEAPDLARIIDHTVLKPETTVEDIRRACHEARQYCFAAVCVNPSYVALAARLLDGSPVKVCSVAGFPLGGSSSEGKAHEAAYAVSDGASEIDMVMNVGMLKSDEYAYVESDIRAVVAAVESERALVKVILETSLLTDEEKVIACVLAQNAGADFVKTSTGFSSGGATTADIALMRRVVGQKMGVKAAGGIRSADQARSMIAHGATRIGASASVAIVAGLEGPEGY